MSGHAIVPQSIVYDLICEYGYSLSQSRIHRMNIFRRGVAVEVFRFFPLERTILQDRRESTEGLLELTLEEALAATLLSSNDVLQEYYRQLSDSRLNQPTENEHVP